MQEYRQKTESRLREVSAEFILSFTGGILVLMGGIFALLWFLTGFGTFYDPIGNLRNIMGEELPLFQIRYAIGGLTTGIAIILVSLMLRIRPQESRRWGIMIVILGGMSILVMGGFMFGMVLSVIGGIVAIRRSKRLQTHAEIPVPQVQPIVTEVKAPEEQNIICRCSTCNIEFGSDEELKRHVIKFHLKE